MPSITRRNTISLHTLALKRAPPNVLATNQWSSITLGPENGMDGACVNADGNAFRPL